MAAANPFGPDPTTIASVLGSCGFAFSIRTKSYLLLKFFASVIRWLASALNTLRHLLCSFGS
jgi:hypothetical protein